VFLAEISSLATSPALLAEVDIVEMLSSAKGIPFVVIIILLTLAALCVFVILYKLIQISQAQSQSVTFLDRFWESKRLDDIYRVAEGLKHSPIAAMFRAGYVELSKVTAQKKENGDGNMSDELGGIENVERALKRAAASEVTHLEAQVPFLGTTASAAPFVGLFGTVWGIMRAFHDIYQAGNANLATVAKPISEALIATAVGLFAAIPAVVAYNYFVSKIRVLDSEMTNFSNDFLNIVRRHFFS
jgi:biopolymer transport protein TolQ